MNENILNKSLLEKDIEQINYYSGEEKQILDKIVERMRFCINNYNSSANNSIIIEKVNNSQSMIPKIESNRAKYVNVLNNAIKRYDRVSIETVNRFDGDL